MLPRRPVPPPSIAARLARAWRLRWRSPAPRVWAGLAGATGPALRALRARAHARPAAPGTPRAGGSAPGWALAWCSVASPHHDNQDCAGACWPHGPAPLGPWAPAGRGHGLWAAVADGVSQGAVGEVAAAALVGHWLRGPAGDDALPGFLAGADAAVANAVAAASPQAGAATGAACWLDAGGRGIVTRVGDCRVLQAVFTAPSGWQLQPLLPDQTYAHCWRHLDAAQWPPGLDPEQPACMAGVGRLGEPEALPLELAEGELLLLCSDGVHAVLGLADLKQRFNAHLPGPADAGSAGCLQALADDLVQSAAIAGSDDDITALVLARCL